MRVLVIVLFIVVAMFYSFHTFHMLDTKHPVRLGLIAAAITGLILSGYSYYLVTRWWHI